MCVHEVIINEIKKREERERERMVLLCRKGPHSADPEKKDGIAQDRPGPNKD